MREIEKEVTDPEQQETYKQQEMDRLLEKQEAVPEDAVAFGEPETTKPTPVGKFADPATFMMNR